MKSTLNKSQQRLVVIVLGSLAMLMTLLWFAQHTRDSAYNTLQQQAQNELARYRITLQGILAKYESLPQLLASHPLLQTYAAQPSNQSIDHINNLFATTATLTGAANIYLLDSSGLTVSANNWNQPTSFIGRNFNYRPYFLQALQGKSGRYYAIGTTSKQRGYYFSYPIRHNQQTVAVIVVKVSLSNIESRWETAWERNQPQLVVADPDGIIFISSRAQWRFKSLQPLSMSQLRRLRQTKRYGDKPIMTLTLTTKPLSATFSPATTIFTIPEPDGTERQYLASHLDMPEAGWRVYILLDLASAHRDSWFTLILIATLLTLGLLVILFITEKINNVRQLREARDLLETRVMARTVDLTASNERLLEEIEEREKTAAELKQTQDELIQAAKLALLGQMSAGINHELNQPLTAIQAYADNAGKFLTKNRQAEAEDNLSQISLLCKKMANIIAQFKVFSRKTSGTFLPVEVISCIADSLRLLDSQIKRNQIQLMVNATIKEAFILGDAVRLEQVFVNLLSNAIQELNESTKKAITINVEISNIETSNDKLIIQFRDSGPGITNVKKIFEPFYTTKEISLGLGLGLTISKRIIESFNGQLTAANHPAGGAVFSVELPLYKGASKNEKENK
ncbi:sensor histidine kinase [Endozoicomonas sp. SM1973]|uniref:C4-dicarboxylate transport sensor protein DctB n=1 Tax=Spartinivicinus marinus TaxID=2994442 RepID=A0A853HX29_9GAMM|nr:ATP-binding protein [Spartinivicinus marinus]MCX4025810.1 ATP-binding protein [Spartinivicinus marinus]NYZ65803.1 sensor histidine kinase [Spartinivicinus marinus]